jgi:hypothetical protein
MDKKLNMPLSIVLGGYLLSLGCYFIRYFHFFYDKVNIDDYFLINVAIVSAISAVYLFTFSLVLYIKSLQKFWTSFSLVSIITLLVFFFLPSINKQIYYMSHSKKLNLNGDKTFKTINKSEPTKEVLVANKKELKKQIEDAKEKMQREKKRREERESKLNNALAINDNAKKSISELQAKLESERKENDRLRKRLNETIRKLGSKDEIILALRSKLKQEPKAEEDIIVERKSSRDSYEVKINSDVVNTDLDKKKQEIFFKIQIIASNTRLATNSPKFKGLKNVWEYKDNGLYKYTVGNQKDLKAASALQSEYRRKGFSGAFVVAFKNGKRIPIKDARKFLN